MSKLTRNALAALILIFPASALAQPVVNALVNNFGGELPGLPNYGIAPGSTFVIYGSGLCASAPLVTQTSAPPAGLPQTLNGMTISVTVNGVTTHPAMYYAIPTQVAAVLPSTTPAGTGTITVNYNGQSGSAPILVAKSAFGILTANSSFNGQAKATDLQYNDISPTASASPGQTIVLWGSGLGADTANTDRTYPMKQDNLNNAKVYIGGVEATVLYAGRSLFPGEDQIDVTIPELGATPAFDPANPQARDIARASAGFQLGCASSVVLVAGGLTSNFTTLPIAAKPGGTCIDPEYGTSGAGLGYGTQEQITVGALGLYQLTQPTTALPAAQVFETVSYATGSFFTTTGGSYGGPVSYSPGSCFQYAQSTKPSNTPPANNGVNAGTPIVLTGPGGLSENIPESATSGSGVGIYSAVFPTALTAGDAYTFAVPGSPFVKPFTTPVTWPGPLTWTNESSIGTITQSDGQLITWSGGAPGTYVVIIGYTNDSDLSLNVVFTCVAPVGDGQLTIPPYVLDTLPNGYGVLEVENFADSQTFTATGLSYAYLTTGGIDIENVIYGQAPAPPAESPFNGNYTGTFSSTEQSGTPISGTVTAVIDNGVFTVTSPGTGTGTVSSTGQITFGVAVAQGVTCTFSGDDVITGTAATASGTFTCPSAAITGTWSVTRQ